MPGLYSTRRNEDITGAAFFRGDRDAFAKAWSTREVEGGLLRGQGHCNGTYAHYREAQSEAFVITFDIGNGRRGHSDQGLDPLSGTQSPQGQMERLLFLNVGFQG